MKPVALFRWLAFVLTGIAVTAGAQAQAISATSIYRNDNVGVQLDLGAEWQLHTTREAAPEELRQHFPPQKSPDESPLFIGVHESGGLYTRILVEDYFDDLEAYVRTLDDELTAQGLTLTRARILPDGGAAEVEYVQRELGLYFIERLSSLEASQVLRMSFWLGEVEKDEFLPKALAAFDTVRVRGAMNQPEGYQPVWKDLQARLPAENLEGLEIAAAREPEGALVCADPGSSMLWEVTGAELDKRGITMHLFGSVHVGKPEFYPLHPVIETQFRAADNLVFEVDPRIVNDPATALQMQARGMLPAGQTLADVVSPEALKELQGILAGFGIPLASLMNLKPWLVTLMLANFQANALGYNAQFGLESYFITQRAEDSEVRQLESLEQQVDMLDSLDHEVFLNYSLEEYERSGSELDAMVEAWRCGDKEAMTAAVFEGMTATEGLGEKEREGVETLNRMMFTDRNVRMADGLEDFIRTGSGSWFVVVGSGHLLGEDSVVDLLQKRGYEVKPVRLEP